ncbi:MAG: DNA polymerase III subunit gamma/tau [Flavihumibacter sp.]
MEQFVVSARKYRPQNFSTVVGQSHITTTLKNAIKNQQLAHAFLFCGPRGVGKTTCARILAKTINCENPSADGEACNSCHSCVSFNEGSSLNIHELDAASNNSVDDIRALVEQVRFAPQAGKYKVYIVDEVHMLSTSAFNAFLKTLEEPPPYAIFILATTEKYKILPTILSRCQIFDFKRITPQDTVEHLEEICEKEKISAEPAALQVIAQKSEGCMRDALSILDKIVSFTNGQFSYRNTLEHLNILDADYYFKWMDHMLNQDLTGALLLYDDINRKGFEGDLVLGGFSEFLRNLLLCKDEKLAALMEVVESFRPKYVQMAARTHAGYLVSALNLLNESEIQYRTARNKKLQVELTLIRLCYLKQALELTADTSSNRLAEPRPVNFRGLTPIGIRQQPVSSKPVQTAPPPPVAAPVEKARPKEPEAKLTVDEKLMTTKTQPSKLSLKNIRQQVNASGKEKETLAAIPLSEEALQTAWKQFTQQLADNKNPAQQSFEMAVLRITDHQHFSIAAPNNLQQKFIDAERIPLGEFLQEQFRNRYLSFQLVIEQRDDQLPKAEAPLSAKERFQLLAEQYPLVKDLKDKLRLELDY